jgi:hypothetical protein
MLLMGILINMYGVGAFRATSEPSNLVQPKKVGLELVKKNLGLLVITPQTCPKCPKVRLPLKVILGFHLNKTL